MSNEKIYSMKFAKVYPLLIAKAERKGRIRAEVDEAACWLTGYTPADIEALLQGESGYGSFFTDAPCLNPDRFLVKGSVCGVRVELIEESPMREIRILDKMVDEIAKGKPMEKVLRKK